MQLTLYCPFLPAVSPHVDAIQGESVAWAVRHGLVSSADSAAQLARARIGRLVARGFPTGRREPLQIAADWTTLFCLLDDAAEQQQGPVRLAAAYASLLDVFSGNAQTGARTPHGDALRDLRARLSALASPAWMARFSKSLEEIFLGFTWEAMNRSLSLPPTPQSYQAMRRITVGLYPQFDLAELMDDLSLAAEVRENPALRDLAAMASAIVGCANDLFTWERELRDGEVHNVVFALMRHEGLPVDRAVERAVEQHDAAVRRFLELERELPDFGALSPQARRHVDVLRAWIRGHFDWAAETGRYQPSHSPAESTC